MDERIDYGRTKITTYALAGYYDDIIRPKRELIAGAPLSVRCLNAISRI